MNVGYFNYSNLGYLFGKSRFLGTYKYTCASQIGKGMFLL